MSGRDDSDDHDGALTRVRAAPARVVKLWDDPTTEDEGDKATKIVDAGPMLEKFRALGGKPAAPKPVTDMEATPAVGAVFALLRSTETTAERPAPNDPELDAPTIEVDEVGLSEEEQRAIAEEDAGEEAEEGAEDAGPADEGALREAELRQFKERLGDLCNVPMPGMPVEDLTSLDHRAAFILSLVDGSMTLEEIVDVSAMPELDTLRTLHELVLDGAIVLDPPTGRS